MSWYIGTLEEIQAVDAKMCENCGLPSVGTTNMVKPIETANSGVYACPVVERWAGFNKEQINAGINQTIVRAVEFVEIEV